MPDTSAHPQGSTPPGDKIAEQTDVSIRGIAWFVVALAVGAVMIHLALLWLQRSFYLHSREEDRALSQRNVVSSVAESVEKFPGPRLQTDPKMALDEFRAREAAVLNEYGWINRTSGVVRLPIERAMDLLLQRGVPVQENGGAVSPLELQQRRPLQREKSPP